MAISDKVRDLFYRYFGYSKSTHTDMSKHVDNIFQETIPGAGSYLENRLRMRKDRWSSYREYAEMDRGIINSALTLIAEDAVSIDIQRNKSVWVETDNPVIGKILNKLIDALAIPEALPAIARGLAKYGSGYEQLFMESGKGVISWKYCPPDVITRVEDHYGRLLGFSPGILEQSSYDLDKHKLPDVMSHPYDFVHFRTMSYDRGMIHGTSVIEGARDYFKPFEMSLHNLIMYRLKNPDRIVWNIDVGSQSPDEQMRTVEMWRRYLKKQQYRAGDKFKNQYDPYSADDDIFFPKPTNSTSSVERLSGSSNYSDIGDVELFINLLFSTLRIPKAYMGFEGEINSKATLVNEDLRYARTIFNIQSALISGLNRLGHIHLMLLGYNPKDEANKFTFALPISTFLLELAKSELWQVRIEMASRLVDMSDRLEPIDKGAFAKYIFMEFLRLPKSVVSQLFISKQEYDQIKQATYGIGGDTGEGDYGDEEQVDTDQDLDQEPKQEGDEPSQPLNDALNLEEFKNVGKVLSLLKEHKKVYTPQYLLDEREIMEPIPNGTSLLDKDVYSSYSDVRNMIETLSCTDSKK